LIGLAGAVNESHAGLEVSPYELPLVYETLPAPLFDDAGLLAFWEAFPTSLLEMCLGCFTKGSPLAERLDRLRLTRQDNPVLDKLFKKMSKREARFGYDWLVKGHHPETEFVQLKSEMASLCAPLKKQILGECAAVQVLARELLAQGPWQMGNLPASSFVRKTPESGLGRLVECDRIEGLLVTRNPATAYHKGLEGERHDRNTDEKTHVRLGLDKARLVPGGI